MSNFVYSTSKTNVIVIKLLHHSALKSQTENDQQYVIAIKFGAVQEHFLY